MAGVWERLRGRIAREHGAATALQRLFAAYPVHVPVQTVHRETFRDGRQDAALAAFLRRREHRLAALLDFFAKRDVTAAPLLASATNGAAAARAIDAWLTATLPRRPFCPVSGDPEPNPDVRAFRAADRGPAAGYYSFLDDLGLLEGEAIRRRDRRFDWAINHLPEQAEFESYGHICLIKPGTLEWAPVVLDLPLHLLSVCHAKMAPGGDATAHAFGEVLGGAVAGTFDPSGTLR